MKEYGPILIVEDNTEDAVLIAKALIEAGVNNETIHFKDGQSAYDYLLQDSNTKPVLILLDLKLSGFSGIEFLNKRMEIESLMTIPVVVLTAVTDKEVKQDAFRKNIAGYMNKPSEFIDMVKIMEAINQYWSFSEVVQRD